MRVYFHLEGRCVTVVEFVAHVPLMDRVSIALECGNLLVQSSLLLLPFDSEILVVSGKGQVEPSQLIWKKMFPLLN